MHENPDSQAGWTLVFIAWVLVAAATLTSLFFSEVMEVPVCELCWYQRIAMYPLVVVFALGLFPFDRRIVRYGGVLAGLGWLVALYHVLLIAGVVPEDIQPCRQGIPCSETHIAIFGFLDIPTLSLLTFSLVGVLLFLTARIQSK
jgi:disulfide bond formation protein DsbB